MIYRSDLKKNNKKSVPNILATQALLLLLKQKIVSISFFVLLKGSIGQSKDFS